MTAPKELPMISNRALVSFSMISLLALAACGEQAPQQSPPQTAPPLDPGTTELPLGHPPIGEGTGVTDALPLAGQPAGGAQLVWTVPEGWLPETPSSQMRRAQYAVPGEAGEGECVVFYFGPGQGGDAMSNASRWAGMFTQPDGGSSQELMKIAELNVGDIEVLTVEVTGTYSGGMGMGAAASGEQPGYMLLGAVAEGPDANWFFKLTGPQVTVEAQRAAFDGMIQSLRRKGS
jgi:hypothetical protein